MPILELMTHIAGVRAFSTRAGFDFERLRDIAPEVVFPVQTHTAEVRVVNDGDVDLQDVDGVVCTRPGVLIGVRTADCLPLLMADTHAGVIAAVHCGWRGTVAGIALRAVEVMEKCGARPERIHAAMGPCICPDCFEVGDEVANLFPHETILKPHASPKPHIDLSKAVSLQLQQTGVRDIALPPACSKHSSGFYSVRRQGRDLTARTLSVISLCQ